MEIQILGKSQLKNIDTPSPGGNKKPYTQMSTGLVINNFYDKNGGNLTKSWYDLQLPNIHATK